MGGVGVHADPGGKVRFLELAAKFASGGWK